ncbi:unnamed protein product [Pseudo-nitzschia multistriata]|uniref:Uncharacterized protein n=1 Tax=Pseudo-nitzschia multistriata TaxID=183589 RepID=A0A448Z3J5_9STRA|nr:unnamed protein product [Pseudo-nitzschia multistriata]
MTKLVSSRRGSNLLLHNLEENDVVFGTKGNGRNEIFLKVLESHSEQYMQLSKFQKMGLIQQIIREWNGNFYILNSKTNDLHLAKRKDHDLSTTDPSSKKLYTSVRRMMNYVNSKVQRKPQHLTRPTTNLAGTAIIDRTTQIMKVIPTIAIGALNPQVQKGQRMNNEQHCSAPTTDAAAAAAPDRPPTAMTAMDYVRKEHITLPLPGDISSYPTFVPKTINISPLQRSVIMVTPEPSPRSAFLRPPPISPLPLSKPDIPYNNTACTAPLSPEASFSSETIPAQTNNGGSLLSKKQVTTPVVPTTRMQAIEEQGPNAKTTDVPGNLEHSAILALISLGASPSS